MSVKIMGQVWELKLPHAEKFVLLAMADHADHDGNNVYPSIPTIARKTGYSERQVQRVINSLEQTGLLVAVQQNTGTPTVYRVDTSGAEKAETNKPVAKKPLTKCHPCQNVTGDIHDTKNGQNVTPTPDIYDTPLIPIKEPSFEPSSEPSVGDADVPPDSAKKRESHYSPDMLAFWGCYPSPGRARGSLKETQEVWNRMTSGERADAMRGLTAALLHLQFCEFPPAPHRWLRARRWETFLGDMTPTPIPPAQTPQAGLSIEQRQARNLAWVTGGKA